MRTCQPELEESTSEMPRTNANFFSLFILFDQKSSGICLSSSKRYHARLEFRTEQMTDETFRL